MQVFLPEEHQGNLLVLNNRIFHFQTPVFLFCISHQLPGTCIGTDFCVLNLLLAPSYFLFSFSWFLSPVYLVYFILILF